MQSDYPTALGDLCAHTQNFGWLCERIFQVFCTPQNDGSGHKSRSALTRLLFGPERLGPKGPYAQAFTQRRFSRSLQLL